MIYVILPIHNRINLTLKCLSCFKNQSFKDFQILIIDDGSSDNSKNIIKNLYPNINIISGNGKWWWTKSLNEGLNLVLPKTDPNDYILIINNDTFFGESYLEKLVATSAEYNRAIVGSLVYKNFNKDIQDAGVKADWHNFTFSKNIINPEKKTNDQVDMLSTRGVLIPVEVFKKIEKFNPLLPHHATDYDFSIKAKKHGFKLIMSYEACIYNQENDTEKQFSFFEKYFNRRSSSNIVTHLTFALINAPTIYLKLKCEVIIVFRFIKTLLKHCLKKK